MLILMYIYSEYNDVSFKILSMIVEFFKIIVLFVNVFSIVDFLDFDGFMMVIMDFGLVYFEYKNILVLIGMFICYFFRKLV